MGKLIISAGPVMRTKLHIILHIFFTCHIYYIFYHIGFECFLLDHKVVESVKTTYMEKENTIVLDKNKALFATLK